MLILVTDVITEAGKKTEGVANDVDAADKKKAEKAKAEKAGKEAKKEAEPAKEAEKPQGDPPVVEGKLEEMVSRREQIVFWL